MRAFPSELAQEFELTRDGQHEVVQVGQRVPVGVESPVQRAVVAEDRYPEGLVLEERHERIGREEPRAVEEDRKVRTGHVRDHEIEGPSGSRQTAEDRKST